MLKRLFKFKHSCCFILLSKLGTTFRIRREGGSHGPINEKAKPRETEVTIEIPENNLLTTTDELALDTMSWAKFVFWEKGMECKP